MMFRLWMILIVLNVNVDSIVERHRAKIGASCALFDTSMKLSQQLVLLVTLNF